MKVSLDKTYKTRRGRDVELHEIRMHNYEGRVVTFPVKGIIVTRYPSGRIRRDFHVWKLNGQFYPIDGDTCEDDLIEVIGDK